MNVVFTTMVNESLACGQFPNGVIHKLVAFLPKEGDRSKFTNWWPIILLNTTHKIFAKALQKHLQSMLVEVIDNDQTTFLPLDFSLTIF